MSICSFCLFWDLGGAGSTEAAWVRRLHVRGREALAEGVDGEEVDGEEVDGKEVDGEEVDGKEVDGKEGVVPLNKALCTMSLTEGTAGGAVLLTLG